MEAIYKCSCKYTKEEHLKFEQFAFHHTGRAKKVAKHCFIMLAVAAALIVLLAKTGRFGPSTIWLPLLWLVGALVYSAINGSLGRKLSWKMSPQVHDAHQHYFFYSDHIEYFIGESGITVPYEAIYSMGETDSNIYLMLNAQQGMSIQKASAPRNLPAFLRDRYNESHPDK